MSAGLGIGAGPGDDGDAGAAADAGLPAVRGEVLVITGPQPGAAPAPADRGERAYHLVTRVNDPWIGQAPVDIHAAALVRLVAVGGDIRVLARVQIDGEAVGVLGPARRAGGVAAVERRRIVRLDRREIRAVEGVHRHHAADRVAHREQLAEDQDQLAG